MLCMGNTNAADQAEYIGSQQCAACHQEEYQAWRGSHHDLAMQAVSEDSVLGDFDNASFEYNGITSRFYRQGGAFWVRTAPMANCGTIKLPMCSV